jgi:TPR repeat protein
LIQRKLFGLLLADLGGMKRPIPILIAAACLAATVHASPAEDVKKADAALLVGDLPTAMIMLRKAADANHPGAQARLGDILRAADLEKDAVIYYLKSAAAGDPAGQVGLGRALADGAGIGRDPVRALELYRKAEQQNYGPAYDQLARAYRVGDLGLAKDLAKAAEYDAKAKALMPAEKTAEKAAK